MNRTWKSLQYLFFDLLAAYGVWIVFFLMRRFVFEADTFSYSDKKFYDQFVNAGVIAVYWVILYALAGLYSDPYRRSRLKEMVTVGRTSLLGVLIIFFTIFLDDHDLLDLQPEVVRRRFALAAQEPFLFSDTIANNVAPINVRKSVSSAAIRIA